MAGSDRQSTTDVLARVFEGTDIRLFEKVKLQAQVLVPVLRALRSEIGEERANRLVAESLREWSARLYREIAEQIPGSPGAKWQAMNAALLPRMSGDGDIETQRTYENGSDFNVTRCRYAEFFRELGEPDLGGLLACQIDQDMAAVGSPEMELTRTQTLMQGAAYCDFRFRTKAPSREE